VIDAPKAAKKCQKKVRQAAESQGFG